MCATLTELSQRPTAVWGHGLHFFFFFCYFLVLWAWNEKIYVFFFYFYFRFLDTVFLLLLLFFNSSSLHIHVLGVRPTSVSLVFFFCLFFLLAYANVEHASYVTSSQFYYSPVDRFLSLSLSSYRWFTGDSSLFFFILYPSLLFLTHITIKKKKLQCPFSNLLTAFFFLPPLYR